MKNSFVIKGNICQTKNAKELDLHENAFAVCVDGVSKGVFDVLPEEYASLPSEAISSPLTVSSFGSFLEIPLTEPA